MCLHFLSPVFFGFPPPLRKQTNTQTLSEGELRKPTKEEGSIRFQCVIVALCHLLSVQSVGRAHLPFQSASQLNHRASFFLSGMGHPPPHCDTQCHLNK